MTVTYDLLKKTIESKGYVWYEDRPNLIGIRTKLDVPNVFNDLFAIAYIVPAMPTSFSTRPDVQQKFLNVFGFRDANGNELKVDGKIGSKTLYAAAQHRNAIGKPAIKVFTITTDPGVYWLKNPMSSLGTAVLKPGQYKDAYQLGFHKRDNNHPALVQTGNMVTVYRDADKDTFAEETGKTEFGFFGINIHRAKADGESISIDKWSAGCQVFPTAKNLGVVLDICEFYKATVNNKFTYTLLKESDLV